MAVLVHVALQSSVHRPHHLHINKRHSFNEDCLHATMKRELVKRGRYGGGDEALTSCGEWALKASSWNSESLSTWQSNNVKCPQSQCTW